MNERESLINLLMSWIKKTREQGQAEEIYLTGSILREHDFREDSDIDLILTGNQVEIDRIKESLKFVNLITQRSIDITLVANDYIDNFSLLYKNANVIGGFCIEQPLTPLAIRLRSLPYFQNDFQIFWYAHLIIRRLALQVKEPIPAKQFEVVLGKYISWLNLRTNQQSVKFSDDKKSISDKVMQILITEKNKILMTPKQPINRPIEKYLHITYWNNAYEFESITDNHQLVQKLARLSDDLLFKLSF